MYWHWPLRHSGKGREIPGLFLVDIGAGSCQRDWRDHVSQGKLSPMTVHPDPDEPAQIEADAALEAREAESAVQKADTRNFYWLGILIFVGSVALTSMLLWLALTSFRAEP